MRNFQSGLFGETHNSTLEISKPGMVAVFKAAFKQELQSKANTEEWPAGRQEIENGLIEMHFLEPIYRIAKSTDTGQHDFLGLRDRLRIAGDDCGISHFLEALLDAS